MQFKNYIDEQIFRRISHLLVNVENKENSIAMFCPFCQMDGCRTSGKRWSPSQRKGFIIQNQSKGYDHATFYCQIELCPSRSLSTGKGGISLQVLADHLRGTSSNTDVNGPGANVQMENGVKGEVHPFCRSSEPRVTVLPPSTRNQQSGLGAALDRKVKERKNQHRNHYQ